MIAKKIHDRESPRPKPVPRARHPRLLPFRVPFCLYCFIRVGQSGPRLPLRAAIGARPRLSPRGRDPIDHRPFPAPIHLGVLVQAAVPGVAPTIGLANGFDEDRGQGPIPPKAEFPIERTLEGITIEDKEQLAKAFSPMLSRRLSSPTDTATSFEQSRKAKSGIEVRWSWRRKEVKDEHPAKASAPTLSRRVPGPIAASLGVGKKVAA